MTFHTRLPALAMFVLAIACSGISAGSGSAPAGPTSVTASAPRTSTWTPGAASSSRTVPLSLSGRQAAIRGVATGFVSYPAGLFAADPAAGFDVGEAGLLTTKASPKLAGRPGVVYDSISKRWLPATAQQLSPDGRSYAYVSLILTPVTNPPGPRGIIRNEIHVVEIATASDRILWTGGPLDYYRVVAYRSDGIFLTRPCGEGCAPDTGHLWKFDANARLITKVTSIPADWHVAGRYAYGFEGQFGFGGADLDRVDLEDGSVTHLITSGPRSQILAVGTDGLIYATRSEFGARAGMIFSVDAEGRTQDISSFPVMAQSSAVADSNGLWFANGEGIWLYRFGVGLSLASHELGVVPIGPLLTS